MTEGLAWLSAFVFTQVVEIPIYVFGAKLRVDEAFCASALTHPIVWFVIPAVFVRLYVALAMSYPFMRVDERVSYWVMVVLAELFAIGVEGGYLAWLKKPRPYRWSLVANLSSVTFGFLCRALFHFP